MGMRFPSQIAMECLVEMHDPLLRHDVGTTTPIPGPLHELLNARGTWHEQSLSHPCDATSVLRLQRIDE